MPKDDAHMPGGEPNPIDRLRAILMEQRTAILSGAFDRLSRERRKGMLLSMVDNHLKLLDFVANAVRRAGR